jgi:alpha-mannosidase
MYLSIIIILLYLAYLLPFSSYSAGAVSSLNVHLICHTHNDVGWIKTVDQYFSGLYATKYRHDYVNVILDTVILELTKSKNRKFIYVEQAYFQLWWTRQTNITKAIVQQLIADGQFEFINGGYSMHDEATPLYIDMIDQTTLGHSFILKEFGESAIPTIGWQIDPFGHSSTQASLLSYEVGFDALYFGRIHYEDHNLRMSERRMEFLWEASPSLGSENRIFTGAFQNGNYGPPIGFCFDQGRCRTADRESSE